MGILVSVVFASSLRDTYVSLFASSFVCLFGVLLHLFCLLGAECGLRDMSIAMHNANDKTLFSE